MSLRLDGTWDTDLVGMAVELDEDGVGTETVTLDAGRYCHTEIDHTTAEDSVLRFTYDALAGAFEDALNAAGSLTYTVTLETGHLSAFYRVTVSSGSFKLLFSSEGDDGEHLEAVLGFDGDADTYEDTHDGFWIPRHMMIPVSGGISRWTPPYEPRDVALAEEAEDGTHYSVSRTQAPMYEDWVQTVEPPESVYRARVSSDLGKGKAVQWTWEDFIKHQRASRPFVRRWEGNNTVHTLRPSGARFAPDLMISDLDRFYELRIDTYRDAVLP